MVSSIYSKKLKSEADAYSVSVSELVMADLVSLGYLKMDAFYVAFPDYAAKSALEARNIMESITRGDKFKSIVKDRTNRRGGKSQNVVSEPTEDGLIDKKQAAMEILRVAQSLPENSKERGEMFVKYSEMLRKNDDTVDVANDHVNYYLPPRCTVECTLYRDWRKAHPNETPDTGRGTVEV